MLQCTLTVSVCCICLWLSLCVSVIVSVCLCDCLCVSLWLSLCVSVTVSVFLYRSLRPRGWQMPTVSSDSFLQATRQCSVSVELLYLVVRNNELRLHERCSRTRPFWYLMKPPGTLTTWFHQVHWLRDFTAYTDYVISPRTLTTWFHRVHFTFDSFITDEYALDILTAE